MPPFRPNVVFMPVQWQQEREKQEKGDGTIARREAEILGSMGIHNQDDHVATVKVMDQETDMTEYEEYSLATSSRSSRPTRMRRSHTACALSRTSSTRERAPAGLLVAGGCWQTCGLH